MRPWHQPWFAAQSKFLDPLAGRLCGTAGANAGCARRAPNPSKLPPWPQPQTGRPAETDSDPPCSSQPPRRGPAHPSTVAYSDHACAAGAPADRAACWITVSPRATALLPLAPRAPLPQPVVIASRGRAGFPPPASQSGGKPPHSIRCRGSPRRLRLREAFAVRPLAGAFEEQQRARRPTDPDPLAPKRRKFCTTPPHTACTAQLNAFPERQSSCVAEPCGGVGGAGHGRDSPPGLCVGRPTTVAPTRRRQAAAVHALPRLPTAPSRSQSVWSAPACWRFWSTALLPETYCPTTSFQARSTPDPIRSSANDIFPQMARFRPAPERVYPTGGISLKAVKLHLQSSLPPAADEVPVAGKNPNLPPSR